MSQPGDITVEARKKRVSAVSAALAEAMEIAPHLIWTARIVRGKHIELGAYVKNKG